MIGKIVPVGDGRSQLLPSFWLLNGACVCFSERGTKKCWNVDLRERNGRGDSMQKGLGVWGMLVPWWSRPNTFECLGVRKAGNKDLLVFSLLWCSCLEPGHVTSSHGAGPSPLSSSLLIKWNQSGSLSWLLPAQAGGYRYIYLPSTYLSIYHPLTIYHPPICYLSVYILLLNCCETLVYCLVFSY